MATFNYVSEPSAYLEDRFNSVFQQKAKPTLHLSREVFFTNCTNVAAAAPDSGRSIDTAHTSDSEASRVSSPLSVEENLCSPTTNITSPTLSSPGLFEIDVKKKKKTFKTEDDRTKFVQDYQKKFKTEMCKNWELRGVCKFSDKCCFAHGRHELQEKRHLHEKFKTKPCKQFHKEGYCAYGLRCQYLHAEAVIPDIFGMFSEKDRLNASNEGRKHKYELLKFINDCAIEPEGSLDQILSKVSRRVRLPVFQKIASGKPMAC